MEKAQKRIQWSKEQVVKGKDPTSSEFREKLFLQTQEEGVEKGGPPAKAVTCVVNVNAGDLRRLRYPHVPSPIANGWGDLQFTPQSWGVCCRPFWAIL